MIDFEKLWPSLQKTLSLFDVLEEITDDMSYLDIKSVTTEESLRNDIVVDNSPQNIEILSHYDSFSNTFNTPKVID